MSQPAKRLGRERVAELLGVRTGMTDFSLFVGRRFEQTLLQGVAGDLHNCAWLFGPARNGKSSLARKIAAEATSRGKRVGIVDASSLPADDFEALLARAVERVRRSPVATARARADFEGLARQAEEVPTLIVFDEFDRHAIRLGLDEQAFLRSHKETHGGLNYLFVTRLDPQRLVEDVSVERSRLLGICGVPIQLPILQQADVRELCRRVLEASSYDDDGSVATRIWREVGGHASAVMDVLQHTVAQLAGATDPVPAAEVLASVDDTISRCEPHLAEALSRHWRDLHPQTRSLLFGLEDLRQPPSTTPAERDGYWNRRRSEVLSPSLLLRAGRREGLSPAPTGPAASDIARVENLFALMYQVNSHLMRASEVAAFAPTPQNLRFFVLLRPVRVEADLHECVEHLAKVIYEGGRDRKPGRDATPDDWRLPEPIREEFRRSEGIRMLVALRNYFDHDEGPGAGTDRPSRREREIGQLLEQACGTPVPSRAEHFSAALAYLLDRLLEAFSRLASKLGERPSQTAAP